MRFPTGVVTAATQKPLMIDNIVILLYKEQYATGQAELAKSS